MKYLLAKDNDNHLLSINDAIFKELKTELNKTKSLIDNHLNEWEIVKKNEYYLLIGISNQREEGRPVRTSKLLNIDFVTGIAETVNTIYKLKNGAFKKPLYQILRG